MTLKSYSTNSSVVKKIQPKLNLESIEKLKNMKRTEKVEFLYNVALTKVGPNKGENFTKEVLNLYGPDKAFPNKACTFYKNNLDIK